MLASTIPSGLILPRAQEVTNWTGCLGSAGIESLVRLIRQHSRLFVLVTTGSEEALEVQNQVSFFDQSLDVMQFPAYETLPYDVVSPAPDIISQRLDVLYRLTTLESGVIVVPIQTLLQRLPPREILMPHMLQISFNEQITPQALIQQLDQLGYRRVDTVFEHGEYAMRGSLLDFFPMGTSVPIRVDFFGDVIDGLRTFDPETQRTVEEIDKTRIIPAHEYFLSDECISRFRYTWREEFPNTGANSLIYQDISEGKHVEGVESYLPLFFGEMQTLFSYFREDTVIVIDNDVEDICKIFLNDVNERFTIHRFDLTRPLLDPVQLYLTQNQLHAEWNKFARIRTFGDNQPRKHSYPIGGLEPPSLKLDNRRASSAKALRDFIANQTLPVLVTAETLGRLQQLKDLLARVQLNAVEVDSYLDFCKQESGLFITVSLIQIGLWTEKHVIVTEVQILGERSEIKRRRARSRNVDPDSVVRDLTELNKGDPVVHIDHGVGRFVGLETLSIRADLTEFVTLEYADKDRLYVPVTSLDLIARYTGVDPSKAPLHKLGSDVWAKAKRNAAKQIYDVAVELLNIYAQRAANTSNALPGTDTDYDQFCDECEFRLTPDQAEATDNVIRDLCHTQATDRLICGDVGFGKTEVAMRAVFHVVQAGFQVVVLVPTTILAQQHHNTFKNRFANWPHEIELLSRFRTKTEVERVTNRIAEGKIDVVIGTHRLLHTNIDFSGIGLLIIDEEHRFGVRDKERIKALKTNVDTISMTATPIPRTLNLSLGGLRDISIITTPPAKRLAVKTFIVPYNPVVVSDAIKRELARGGQVFFVHNKVTTIYDVHDGLKNLVPSARIDVGHGQMNKIELEQVMSDFYHRKTNVLVCTTIVESGIDVPNANTIIIDRADKFGLAQLHQLRGRVGRSTRQAYAYLLIPPDTALTLDAKQRLDAIESAGDLGAGFSLAMHDLEIRGAGEILGQQQHGQLEAIGFSLYMQMLNRTVDTIKSGAMPNFDNPLPMTHEIDLRTPTLFPDDYIPSIHTRLVMYKRLTGINVQLELDEFKAEVIDRFGPLPDPAENLFRTTYLKIQSQPVGVNKIVVGPDGGHIDFCSNHALDPMMLVSAVSRQPQYFQVMPNSRIRVKDAPDEIDERFQLVENFVRQLRLSAS